MGGKYQEAPVLAALVAAGELPPVEERLPAEPAVRAPLEQIGTYGGTINVLNITNLPWGDMGEMPERATYLLQWSDEGTITGNLAAGFEFSADKGSFTLQLREGAKWSDGHPFTADDFVFMFEGMHWNENVSTWPQFEPVKRVIKVDDLTVRFESDAPYPLIALKMTTWNGSDWVSYHPRHYLEKWHINHNPKAEEVAKEEGFDTWWEALYAHYWWAPLTDIDKPTLQPWVLTETTTERKVFERNPYYWKVDTAGNQLPYIDGVVAAIVDKEVYQLKVISGETDVAYVQTSFEDFSLYKENEARGDYRVIPVPGIYGSEVMFGLNQNDPDPAMRALFQDLRFRRALSLAINRAEINDIVYYGLLVARQATILPSASFFEEEWAQANAEYDPGAANGLLDEMGLTARVGDGFRVGEDGKAVLLLVEYSTGELVDPTTTLEQVKEYWEAIGLQVLLKPLERTLMIQRQQSADHGIIVSPLSDTSEIASMMERAAHFLPPGNTASWAYDWGTWLRADREIRLGSKTLADFEGGVMPGEEPPAQIKELATWVEGRERLDIGSPEYLELSRKVYAFHADNLYMIGTVGMAPTLYIAKNSIGNVPTEYPPPRSWAGDLTSYADQLFFRQ